MKKLQNKRQNIGYIHKQIKFLKLSLFFNHSIIRKRDFYNFKLTISENLMYN